MWRGSVPTLLRSTFGGVSFFPSLELMKLITGPINERFDNVAVKSSINFIQALCLTLSSDLDKEREHKDEPRGHAHLSEDLNGSLGRIQFPSDYFISLSIDGVFLRAWVDER